MTPEEKARVKIDQWFADAGWKVVNRDEYEPTISAVAIREGLLKGNLEADYFLFINGKAVGVLEANDQLLDFQSKSNLERVSVVNPKPLGKRKSMLHPNHTSKNPDI